MYNALEMFCKVATRGTAYCTVASPDILVSPDLTGEAECKGYTACQKGTMSTKKRLGVKNYLNRFKLKSISKLGFKQYKSILETCISLPYEI